MGISLDLSPSRGKGRWQPLLDKRAEMISVEILSEVLHGFFRLVEQVLLCVASRTVTSKGTGTLLGLYPQQEFGEGSYCSRMHSALPCLSPKTQMHARRNAVAKG